MKTTHPVNTFRLLILMLLPALGCSQDVPAPILSTEQLSAYPTDSWVTNGGNLYNQRYSPLTEINRDNVANLKADWRVHMNGSGTAPNHSGQAQPLYYNGVLYTVTGEDDVFAIDVETGEFRWTYQANLDPDNVNVCCGWVSRGVGMGAGQIYVGQLDAKLVALDQETGEINWSIQAEDPHQGYSITAAPLYYNGMVITGFAGGEMATRGRVKAYDAEDGSLLWTFYTIPAPGEPFGDSWPADNNSWETGGAPVWQTPAIDPELGLIYFSTGNAAPDLNGSVRPGDNLFSVSILALDVMTGEYRWHFQQVHHDIWDYDSPSPVVLFDVEINGVARKGLAEASKTGFLYILDRITGEPLIGIEERPVPQEPSQATAATQPYPIGDSIVPQYIDAAPEGFQLVNEGRIFTPFSTEPVLYKPLAAVNWPPKSYDPDTNLIYICANDRIGGAMQESENSEPTHDQMWLGGGFRLSSIPARGLFVAMDVTTNTIAWRQQWNYSCSAGSIVTAGGLIFHGRNDGRVTAMDKSNGNTLWEFQTDAGVNGSASTFMHNGAQHVAIISAGSIYSPGVHGDSVWLFSLEGQMDEIAAETTTAPGLRPTGVTNALATIEPPAGREPDLANGLQVYSQICSACHGPNGEGGHGGGIELTGRSLSISDIMTVASYGRNTMPAFVEVFSAEQLHDVGAYILEEIVTE
ncbi:PQQ-binding-like beta-propeller repeat protein [Gammaproteobacteria bacterium]|nr:PQQ-binding-like beta-propeller repeat protein [Gammaproteobacteria bacterium]